MKSPLRGIIGGSGGAAATNYKGTSTWAGLPSAATNTGNVYFVTDAFSDGTNNIPMLMYSDGARWKPHNGMAQFNQGAAISGITNTEQIIFKIKALAGVLLASDVIEIQAAQHKSGTTDTGLSNMRMGTAGTTADAVLLAKTVAIAANTSGGFVHAYKLMSATSSQGAGTTGTGNIGGSYTGGASVVIPGAVAVPDITANANFVSIGMLSGGATNTVSGLVGRICFYMK